VKEGRVVNESKRGGPYTSNAILCHQANAAIFSALPPAYLPIDEK
jgi:hypothetical protein